MKNMFYLLLGIATLGLIAVAMTGHDRHPSILLIGILLWGGLGIHMMRKTFKKNTCQMCDEVCDGSYCSKSCEQLWLELSIESYKNSEVDF